MGRVIPLERVRLERLGQTAGSAPDGPVTAPAIRTDAVYVLFTAVEETLVAADVAAGLSKAFGAPLTIVHLRTVPYPLPVDMPGGISPMATDRFQEQVRAMGVDARLCSYVCRNQREAFSMAFNPHSLIVVTGRPSRWPTQVNRLVHGLQSLGHRIVFVPAGGATGRSLPVATEQRVMEASHA